MNASPNQFMAPLRYNIGESSKDVAYRRAKAHLAAEYQLVDAIEERYLHATTPEGELELRFLEDDPAVTFRLLASKPTPMQPFCATRGCINGNQLLRARVESIKLACGWRSDDSYLEEDRLAGWVPIFLH